VEEITFQKAVESKSLHQGFYRGLDVAFADGKQRLRDFCGMTVLEWKRGYEDHVKADVRNAIFEKNCSGGSY